MAKYEMDRMVLPLSMRYFLFFFVVVVVIFTEIVISHLCSKA